MGQRGTKSKAAEASRLAQPGALDEKKLLTSIGAVRRALSSGAPLCTWTDEHLICASLFCELLPTHFSNETRDDVGLEMFYRNLKPDVPDKKQRVVQFLQSNGYID